MLTFLQDLLENYGVVATIAGVLLWWTLRGQGVRDERIKNLEEMFDKILLNLVKENGVTVANNTNAMNNMADAWASCETILKEYKNAA